MTWADFYMACFLFGLILSMVSLLVGVLNIHFPGLDHVHLHNFHLHFHADGVQLPDANGVGPHISPFNFSTLMAFLAWFGGAGYLLTVWKQVGFLAVFALATGFGLVGGMVVFAFISKVLMRTDSTLYESDYRMEGLLGHVSVGIRAGGTGEIIFSQEGVRRTCGARSEEGGEIAKGTEVVITRYEGGIAYVRRWEEMAREAGVTGGGAV